MTDRDAIAVDLFVIAKTFLCNLSVTYNVYTAAQIHLQPHICVKLHTKKPCLHPRSWHGPD